MKKEDFEKLSEEDRMFMLWLDKWMIHFAYWALIGLLLYIVRT